MTWIPDPNAPRPTRGRAAVAKPPEPAWFTDLQPFSALRVADVCRWFGVPTSTVHKWIAEHRIPRPIRTLRASRGRKVRLHWPLEVLREWRGPAWREGHKNGHSTVE